MNRLSSKNGVVVWVMVFAAMVFSVYPLVFGHYPVQSFMDIFIWAVITIVPTTAREAIMYVVKNNNF